MANCAVRPLIVVSLQGRGGCEARHALVGCCIRTDGRELTPRGRADQGPGHLDTDKHLMIVENALCRRNQVKAVGAATRVTAKKRAGRAISTRYLPRYDVQRRRLAAAGASQST